MNKNIAFKPYMLPKIKVINMLEQTGTDHLQIKLYSHSGKTYSYIVLPQLALKGLSGYVE